MERAIARGMAAGHAPIAVQGAGSYSARESASADSRDQLDFFAGLVCRAIERSLRLYLEHAFGAGEQFVCAAAYGQVEERDQNKYIDTLQKYYSFRASLSPAARAVIDKLLDIPSDEADTGAQADPSTPASEAPRLELSESYTPPKDVQAVAQRALEWIEEGREGDGFTDVGRVRAGQLARGEAVSRDIIERMVDYFSRHDKDQEAPRFNDLDDPSPGRVAWDAWGGTKGKVWAERILRRINNKTED
jgi:hypothetical protein